jgi:hypothetical protein
VPLKCFFSNFPKEGILVVNDPCVLWWVVGILSVLWVFSLVRLGSFVGCFGLSFLDYGVLFPFSVSCCGLAFGVSCVYFLCIKGRLYAFLINLFLPIKKKMTLVNSKFFFSSFRILITYIIYSSV